MASIHNWFIIRSEEMISCYCFTLDSVVELCHEHAGKSPSSVDG